jgi:protein-disulfide isomerase
LFSGVVIRCVVAASTLDDGRDQAWSVLRAVADHREEFVCENHATGPNRKAAPDDIIGRVEEYSGVKLADAFRIPDLDSVIKWHAKYARQNGIHSTPTFMANGVVQPQLGSGDEIDVWAAAIRDAARY